MFGTPNWYLCSSITPALHFPSSPFSGTSPCQPDLKLQLVCSRWLEYRVSIYVEQKGVLYLFFSRKIYVLAIWRRRQRIRSLCFSCVFHLFGRRSQDVPCNTRLAVYERRKKVYKVSKLGVIRFLSFLFCRILLWVECGMQNASHHRHFLVDYL